MLKRSSLLVVVALSFLSSCQPAAEKPAETKVDTKVEKVPNPHNKKPESTVNDLPAPPDVAAAPADAPKTATGLASKVLKPAAAPDAVKPGAEDIVEVHYTGWTTDGKMFDSSVKRGKPAKFPLNGVIAGWTEGLQLMGEGEARRFWIPEELAYKGRPGKPAGMLVFDVELLKVHALPKTPEDVAAVPKTATKTKSGLAWRQITKGTGATKPKPTDTVEVHYAGWTLDGKLFDTSYKRGQTTKFPLNGVIKGWTEGLQLMNVGDKFRFWIPADLAYGETPSRPGAPAGMLVFDVELISIAQ
ncbi:MAG: FKBP-type peptidyl-prolyl cis-trans isomerase [Deltaproteobacteria bacterium]|nr:FKBP-type peptidyl-prolyl cis-trans isomerase [Deltaproteobacteria bacterium]